MFKIKRDREFEFICSDPNPRSSKKFLKNVTKIEKILPLIFW